MLDNLMEAKIALEVAKGNLKRARTDEEKGIARAQVKSAEMRIEMLKKMEKFEQGQL